MKKTSILKFLVGITLTASAVFAVGSALNSKRAEKVEAASYSGRLVIKDNVGWYEGTGNDQAGKAAVYLYNGNTNNGWSKSFSLKAGTGNVYVAEYSNLSFNPINMIVVRLKNSAPASPSWSDQAYGNQTVDLDLNDATSLNGWDNGKVTCSQWAVTGNVYTSENNFVSPKVSMGVSTVEINDEGHPQVSGVVTLAKNETFKVVNAADNTWSGYYGCPEALNSAFTGGSKTQVEGSSDIECLIAGSYDFYFDTETKKTWISRQDIVDADGWAKYFNNNVGCDPNGAVVPTGWSLCETAFNNLGNAAKDYVYGGTANANGDNLGRALATYDYAVAHHASLYKFIKNSSNVVRASNVQVGYGPFVSNSQNTNTIAIIVIISLVSVTAISGFFFIRKRKAN